MLTNYHTHTSRCHHASGTDRDYVEKAIEGGIQALGFSDHSPYLFDGDYYSSHRMRPEETIGYISSIRELSKEYESQITLLTGYEIEYYPKYFSRTVHFLSELGCDYLILGQHFIGNEETYSGRTSNYQTFDHYIHQVIEALETGMITYLCHPDLCLYTGDEKLLGNGYTMLCEEAKRMNIPIELNMYGLMDKRHYPSEAFFKIAAEIGNIVIPGCDAHDPNRFVDKNEWIATKAFADKCGITLSELTVDQVLARKEYIK